MSKLISADALRALLKKRSAGEVETWGFVAAFLQMIDEIEEQTPTSPALALPEEPHCVRDIRSGAFKSLRTANEVEILSYIDSLRAAAEALSSKLNEAIDILSSVDDTGLLYKHNLDVDAKVANFLAQIDDEEKKGKKWLFPYSAIAEVRE